MPRASSSSVRVFSPRWTRAELIAHLRERVARLRDEHAVERAVLFGSWARDEATAASDVDVLVVVAGEPDPALRARAWRTLDTRGIELHLYGLEDARALAEVLDRMTREGVDLL